MKVFSKEVYLADNDVGMESKIRSINAGWLDIANGLTEEEMGENCLVTHPDWMVDQVEYTLEADTTNGIYAVEGFGTRSIDVYTIVDVYDLEYVMCIIDNLTDNEVIGIQCNERYMNKLKEEYGVKL